MNTLALALLATGALLFAAVLMWPDSEFDVVLNRTDEGDTSPAVFHGISDRTVRLFMYVPHNDDPSEILLRRALRESAEHVLRERGVL